ncbi:hypothetical protein ASE06_13115 [Sphingopyxis sp. Root214]|uniref:DUF1501 domain-containing protein n=1 Tax=unclassified Sphingopyxis TaxID=2614943 RepID=UPI0006FB9EFD|nr:MULTISPECIES: DUF1501 domain-containing protein [unclassified Sphingopyxis]KQZ73329.1 hypothetical protein ASD73_10765 [Sphingopyxis sp. Root154]KRC07475.1 hypothetical protein ASE06_13115 [Sphingopyxis sp. Root214]
MILSRRSIILSGITVATAGALPHFAYAAAGTPKRLVFIIQRGAADGLATVAPTGDPAFAAARRAMADETMGGAKLDAMFTLHPAMAATAGLYTGKQAHFAHAVATAYRDRSHFDGQNMLEGGGARPYGRDTGWVGRLLTLLPAAERDAIAIAPAVPLALRGTVQVGTYAPSRLPQADADLIARLTALYQDDPLLHPLWDSAVKTQELASDIGGNNGRNGADLGKLAASLMLPEDGARVMMVETGGWDTHSGQRGRLAAQLRGLDQLVGALQTGLGSAWNDTLIIVATEFGRTVEVNGTGGTDHGTASTAMLLGGGLAAGGKVSADWPGLGAAARYEGRDLKPTRSLESVIAGAVAHHYALDPKRVMTTLYPDAYSRIAHVGAWSLAFSRPR